MSCRNYELPPIPNGKFIGCDGKEWDEDFLLFHIQKAVKEENYEWAHECIEELKRRDKLKLKEIKKKKIK